MLPAGRTLPSPALGRTPKKGANPLAENLLAKFAKVGANVDEIDP